MSQRRLTLGGWHGERSGMDLGTLFSVEQANATLPYVQRIVCDIVTGYGRWQQLVRDFEVATAGSRADAPDANADALQKQAQRAAEDIEACQDELAKLGVEFKGYEQGLVDFPAERNGRPVFLCWQLGEPAVLHWHDRDAGFAGRRPLEGETYTDVSRDST